MRINLKQGETLTGVLASAANSANPTVRVDWRDQGDTQSTYVTLTDDTAVTLINSPFPGGRTVESVSVVNVDDAAVTVTLSHVTADGTFRVAKQTLQVDDALMLADVGLQVVDSSGQAKSTSVTTAVEAFPILPTQWRVHDAFATNLPATAGTDDLGAVLGTDGTNFASLQSVDFKAASTTSYARCFVALPSNYVAGSAITLRLRCGMITTVSDTAPTIDVNAYSNDGDATGSADLCNTDAQEITSLTFSNKDFTITPTGLVAGQLLNIKLTFDGTDSATGTAVIGAIAAAELRCTVQR